MNKEEFREIKETLDKIGERTEKNESIEKAHDWPIQDSGLVSTTEEQIYPYNYIFRELYPSNFPDIRGFLEKRFESKKGKLIGVEFGGVGKQLFSDFSPGMFERTAGVTLVDRNKNNTLEKNDAVHSILEADLFSSEGRHTVESWLRGKKADMIFEKMHGAFEDFPSNINFLFATFDGWYAMLNDGGIMFIETPPLNSQKISSVSRFFDFVNSTGCGLKVNYRHNELVSPASLRRIYFMLEKNEGAPESLKGLAADFLAGEKESFQADAK